ncbi:hypothetical protein Tsubulata_017730, partial [Turnera subulata]
MPGTAILPLPAPPANGSSSPPPPSQVVEAPEERPAAVNEEDQQPVKAPIATHTRTIGIIHPPPDIRTIVDMTAPFVSKHGPEFEKRIIADNTNNAKFNFLNISDPYHAFYQHRLSEFRAQNQAPSQQQPSDSAAALEFAAPSSSTAAADAAGDGPEVVSKPDPSAQFRPPPPKILTPPEAEQYNVKLPEGITREELDIIKVTAQFVARNGSFFLLGWLNNPRFHFLKANHSMFSFFTALADAYSKVLMPPQGLTKSVADVTTVLASARQKAKDEIEKERLQMAMIGWHDCVLVETIDFADDEDEDLPIPMTLEEVEMEMDEEEVQLVEEGMRGAILEEHDESPMRIVNWKRPEERTPAERDPTKFVVSPITGELISISEMSEHMRISLIDPKYKEQKERMFAKIRETTLAQDDEISRNIVGLARTRPDIFGTTEEEVSNAVKAEIEKKKDEQPKQNANGEDQNEATLNDARDLPCPAAPPPRPGIPSIRPLPPPPTLALNVPRMPPNTVQFSVPVGGSYPAPPPRPPGIPIVQLMRPPPPPMSMTSGGQQIMGNRPPMPPSMPVPQNTPVPPPPGYTHHIPRPYAPLPVPQPSMPMMPPPPEDAPPPLPDEPEPKRQRLDDSALIPEDQFLAQHPGAARITISVPNVDEGNLKGQALEITVQSLSETKIAGEIQLPASKQKLSGKAGFLKDNMSLAYYNVGSGETLSLSLGE